MNEKIRKYQIRLFNKLFSTLPSIKKIKRTNSFKLKEKIKYFYYSRNKDYWFTKGETEEKYLFFFGKRDKSLKNITLNDACLIIDFNKNIQFDENSLGMFSIENSELHIILNNKLLAKKYPYITTSEFKNSVFKSLDNKLTLDVIDLGAIYEDFIDNLEKLIENASRITANSNPDKTMEYSDLCNICSKNKSKRKIHSDIYNLKNLRPELCGECIEKIFTSEFYKKISPLIFSNETKSLNGVKEMFGDDHLFDFGMKLLEKHDIINYIGVKKLFFTLDNKSKLISEFIKYSDKDNLLIDNFITVNTKTKPKQSNKMNLDNTNLTRIVKKKMRVFIGALEDGKTHEDALITARINPEKIEKWYENGKNGQQDYMPFYRAYYPYHPTNKRNHEMDEFLEELKKDKNIDNALKNTGLELDKVISWYNLGKKGDDDYRVFYFTCNLLLPDGMPQDESKNLTNNDKEEKISNTIQNESINDNNQKLCKLCGRTLNQHTQKDICKRCARKQYASKIILKLTESIEPGIKFKKEDLKLLGLKTFQIQDYLWTLQEFNLIIEENNKFKLKDKETLERFIEKSGIETKNIKIEKSEIKLNKTCEKCGETLEISKFAHSDNTPDGYDTICKDCRKLITAAGYLKEIIEYVDYNTNFSEDSLKPYFKDSFLLQGKLWSLIDNDLVKRNFEENNYILSDEKTINKFLDKYYEEKPETTPVNEKTVTKKPEDSKDYTKEDQMEIVIEEIKNGKSRKEAAEIAQIPVSKIIYWYTEGKQGFGKDNVNFYKQLNELINENKNNNLKRNNENIYKQKEINRKIFFENFKNGKTKEESAENSQLELSLINEWYLKGKNGEEPFKEFYDEYIKAEKEDEKPNFPQIKKTDQFGTYNTITQMNIILKNLAKGMDEKEAVENSNISFDTYKYWINRGKQKFGEVYTQFYQYVNEIKNGKYEIPEPQNIAENSPQNINLEKILVPLPEEYEDHFKSLKMNRTGIAWVNIIGKQWIYQKTVDNQPIKITNPNIYKLYDEVKENNLPWGIRDFDLARKVISENEELSESIKYVPKSEEIKDIDPDIYAPLPEEYEESFKSSPMNQTGIAWVNAPGTGNKWMYKKSLNGKAINIVDENIYELHKKVKAQNHIWGIRDYSKAKKIIKIPDDFEIPKKLENKTDINLIPSYIDPEIYAPLPKELEVRLSHPKHSQTGIAWVYKSGHNWRYSRSINKNHIVIIDENIYRLFDKVKKENLEWGIRDYNKAKKIIKIPEDYIPLKESEEKIKYSSQELFTPLPNEYKKLFNSAPNKTGIAWVNKNGNNWTYQREVNGMKIRFSDPDIYKLHEIVIKNNHIWGIIDLDKAIKTVKSSQEEIGNQKIKTAENTHQNVSVINVGKNENNNSTYIIKGIIKSYELLKILNKLDIFEQDFKRIITNSIDGKIDLFIELEIKKNLIYAFEERIKEFNWKIN